MTAWTWRDGQMAERSSASGLSGGFTPPMAVFAGERANADIYQSFWDSMWSPGSRGTKPDGKYALRRIQRWPTPLKSVSGRGGILVFDGLAAIFARLEFAGLLNRQRLAAKRSGYASR
jgi:hypothetical protein